MGCGRKYFYTNQNILQERRELILNIGKIPYEKHDQRTCTCFLETYIRISLYDIDFDIIYSIGDEDIHFVKVYGYNWPGNPYNPDGNSTDHGYFSFVMTCLTES